MPPERKTVMISVRLPVALVTRVDFIARNTTSEATANRSKALHAAVEAWVPTQEKRLTELGVIEKKTR